MDWAYEEWKQTHRFDRKKPHIGSTVTEIESSFSEKILDETLPSEDPVIELPPSFVPIIGGFSSDVEYNIIKSVIKYLKTRNIDKQVCMKCDMRFCFSGEYAGRLIIPIIMKGKVRGWIGRLPGKASHSTRYKNSESAFGELIFNYDNIDADIPVVICEGVFDALAVNNAVAVFGKKISLKQQLLLDKFDQKIILFDSDAHEAAIKAAIDLHAKVALIPESKPKEDPSSLGREKCLEVLSKAVAPNSADILMTLIGD